jgi:hypothetical protein
MRPMHVAPRFLFIPVSGPGGAGEYYRSLAIASGLQRRWPGCSIRFLLNREAPYASSSPYPVTLLDDSPTRATAGVNACLERERPDVVLFDSSGRLAQYRAAHASGAAVVYVSSRPKTRWKGFKWRRMALLDQHWIAQPEFLGGALTPWQRLKLSVVGRPRVLFLDALHEPVDAAGTQARQQALGVTAGGYVLLCPGGGGLFEPGIDAAQVFFEAARELAVGRQELFVAVLGPRICEHSLNSPLPPNLKIIDRVPNGVLLGLIRSARLAAVNGGSLLLQSLTQSVPLVAAPIAQDQIERVRRCAEAGYVGAAALDAASLATAVRRLLDDHVLRDRLRSRIGQLALRNGVETATEAVAQLLDEREKHREVRQCQ